MSNSNKSDTPNIVVIMSDEHGGMFSSVAGHPLIQTPNMDRLASEGTTFDNAYCNSPLCVPSRASFLSGKFLSNVRGGWDNAMPLAPDGLTWPYLLRSRGYSTVLDGKMHFLVPGALHGFQRQLTREPHQHNKHYIHRWRDGMATEVTYSGQSGQHWSPLAVTPTDTGTPSHHPDEQTVIPAASASPHRWEQGATAGPGTTEYIDFDDDVETAALAYIDDQANHDQPFALCIGFLAPHPPFVVPEPYFSMYYPDNTDLPDLPPGHLDELPPAARRLREMLGFGPYNEDDLRRARAAYYGMITYLDDKIGRILDALDENDLADNTLVVYTTDHGEMLGEHGMFRKMNFYEQSAHIPLQMRLPGVIPAGRRVPEVVSLVDVSATIVDLCGVDIDRWYLDGDNLIPLINGDSAAWKNEAFVEFLAHGTDRARAMIRIGNWKLCYGHCEPPELELYNLETDPGEFDNLANRPEFSAVQKQLLSRIREHWRDPDDLTHRAQISQEERSMIREQTLDEHMF